jgi:thiamine pyrophosphate-dependent acetolactate synthase large subunit-like protein
MQTHSPTVFAHEWTSTMVSVWDRVAAAYGVQSETVKSLSDLTHAVRDGLSSDRPLLIEISQRRIADS